MFRGLHRLMIAAADWHPRDLMIGAIGAELVTLFTIICLGFGTFAAYTHLSASQCISGSSLRGSHDFCRLRGGRGHLRCRPHAMARKVVASCFRGAGAPRKS
jgi:hypothetical protein